MEPINFRYAEHYKKDADEFDYFEERNGATEHDERRLREYIIPLIPDSADTILDVGCGSAWIAKNMLPKKKKVISLDISVTNPQKALSIYPSLNHSGLTADSFTLPFKDNTFDCIVASEIIEHVVSPADFVKELLRVLKPSGKLIISTPYKEKIQYVLCIHCNKTTPLHSHIHSFDEKMLMSYPVNCKTILHKTGNKALLHLRTYILLKYLPFKLWNITDKLANAIIPKQAHIIAEYKKL